MLKRDVAKLNVLLVCCKAQPKLLLLCGKQSIKTTEKINGLTKMSEFLNVSLGGIIFSLRFLGAARQPDAIQVFVTWQWLVTESNLKIDRRGLAGKTDERHFRLEMWATPASGAITRAFCKSSLKTGERRRGCHYPSCSPPSYLPRQLFVTGGGGEKNVSRSQVPQKVTVVFLSPQTRANVCSRALVDAHKAGHDASGPPHWTSACARSRIFPFRVRFSSRQQRWLLTHSGASNMCLCHTPTPFQLFSACWRHSCDVICKARSCMDSLRVAARKGRERNNCSPLLPVTGGRKTFCHWRP